MTSYSSIDDAYGGFSENLTSHNQLNTGVSLKKDYSNGQVHDRD